MKKLLDLISIEVGNAFEKASFLSEFGRVTISNRPDLCEFQCNGAMAAAKKYGTSPMNIAQPVATFLEESKVFLEVAVVAPGFLNLKLREEFITDYLKEMKNSKKFGLEEVEIPKTYMIDYGGPNIAKALHVGHLRSAVIGECVKRMVRYMGHTVIGDIHMGDWGLPMGLIMTELKERKPELIYFVEDYSGTYPQEAPFTIGELEEIYPTASSKSKIDEEYKAAAMEATYKLQSGVPGYRALWKQILAVSVADLRKNYEKLNVSFDLWNGESEVHNLIPHMVTYMKENNYAYISDGALVVDVKKETDAKEVPPCMILKSDGAALYNTTDLATIMDRMEKYNPDTMIYVVDKRQELYFEQVFRCAEKTKLIKEETKLKFLGFGTMNGKDGKPFKTRDGGVMRLETLIQDINDEMYRKIMDNREVEESVARQTAQVVALAAVKYGDLSNQAAKDYVFDTDRFTSFEGDTGPYILYTIVRIKSILAKFIEQGGDLNNLCLKNADSPSEKDLMLNLSLFSGIMEAAFIETAPHKLCAYIYELANAFNKFYHETKIMTQEDEEKKSGYIALLVLTRDMLENCIDILGFNAPERM